MSDLLCFHLAGTVPPETSELQRRNVRITSGQSPHSLERHDRNTFLCDWVYHEESGEVLFTAPRFPKLCSEVRDRSRLDGAPVRGLSRRRNPFCEQVTVKATRGARWCAAAEGRSGMASDLAENRS